MIGSRYTEIKAGVMTFFRSCAAGLLALATYPLVAQADDCQLHLAGLEVEVERRDAQLDLAVFQSGLLRTRLTLPADGPLRGCWTLDLDADNHPEVVIATAETQPGQPARLRAFHWTGERLEPVSLPTLTVSPAFSDAPHERLAVVGAELERTLVLGSREQHFRYNRQLGEWMPLASPSGRAADNAADSLLQAPIER